MKGAPSEYLMPREIDYCGCRWLGGKSLKVMVLGAWAGEGASAEHIAYTDDLDKEVNNQQGCAATGTQWAIVQCRNVVAKDRAHFRPVGAGQILKAHMKTFDEFFE